MNRAVETCRQHQIQEDAHSESPTKVTGNKLEKIMAEKSPNLAKDVKMKKAIDLVFDNAVIK